MEEVQAATQVWLGIPVNVWGTWLGALLTLAIFSFLYADNPVYKAAEHLFVGVSAAYGVVIYFHDYVIPDVYQPLFDPGALEMAAPKWLLLIPVGLGLLILTRFVPRYDYFSRWPIALSMGAGAGLGIPVIVQGIMLKHMHATMSPMLPVPGEIGAGVAINNLLILVGVVCTLTYFYFSLEHKGVVGHASRLGIWFLMVAFGAAFGNTVMARITLLIGRIHFLLHDFLPTLRGPFILSP